MLLNDVFQAVLSVEEATVKYRAALEAHQQARRAWKAASEAASVAQRRDEAAVAALTQAREALLHAAGHGLPVEWW